MKATENLKENEMADFTREIAERVAEINSGKVSPNMDYVTFPGHWSKTQISNFNFRYNNTTITNGTGTVSAVKNPMSNGDFVRTSIVMISWN